MKLLLEALGDRRLLAVVLGSLAVVAGSWMPWLHSEFMLTKLTDSGIAAGSGKMTFVLGLLSLGAAGGFAALRARDIAAATAALGLASGGLALLYRIDILRAAAEAAERSGLPEVAARVAAGAGVWTVLGGGLAVAAGGIALAVRPEPPADDEPPDEP